MSFHVFDLFYVAPDQVYEFLLSRGKEGLVAGIYLWVNKSNGKMYVGSSMGLRTRMTKYFTLNHAHGVIGQALRKYGLGGFILVIFLVPEATKDLVLSLEQLVLDSGVCEYNILPTAGSRAGVKHSEETRGKMSAAKMGAANPQYGQDRSKTGYYNKGEPVYLYVVHAKGFELNATFLNGKRCSETLGVNYKTLMRRIKYRTVFQINGLSHIVSRDGNLGS